MRLCRVWDGFLPSRLLQPEKCSQAHACPFFPCSLTVLMVSACDFDSNFQPAQPAEDALTDSKGRWDLQSLGRFGDTSLAASPAPPVPGLTNTPGHLARKRHNPHPETCGTAYSQPWERGNPPTAFQEIR